MFVDNFTACSGIHEGYQALATRGILDHNKTLLYLIVKLGFRDPVLFGADASIEQLSERDKSKLGVSGEDKIEGLGYIVTEYGLRLMGK